MDVIEKSNDRRTKKKR